MKIKIKNAFQQDLTSCHSLREAKLQEWTIMAVRGLSLHRFSTQTADFADQHPEEEGVISGITCCGECLNKHILCPLCHMIHALRWSPLEACSHAITQLRLRLSVAADIHSSILSSPSLPQAAAAQQRAALHQLTLTRWPPPYRVRGWSLFTNSARQWFPFLIPPAEEESC